MAEREREEGREITVRGTSEIQASAGPMEDVDILAYAERKMEQLNKLIERLEAALHFIAAWGGKRTEEGVNASGTWCAEQARSALRGGEGE